MVDKKDNGSLVDGATRVAEQGDGTNVDRRTLLKGGAAAFGFYLISTGCGDDGGSGSDGGGGGGAVNWPGASATHVYRVMVAGMTVDLNVKWDETEMIGGKTYRRIVAGDFTQANPRGIKIWIDTSNPNEIRCKRVETYYGFGAGPDLAKTYDDEWVVPLDGAEGSTFSKTGNGVFTAFAGGPADPVQQISNFTLVSRNATVTGPNGPITGCIHFATSSTETANPPAGPAGTPFLNNFYFKDGVGLAAADVGFGLQMPGLAS